MQTLFVFNTPLFIFKRVEDGFFYVHERLHYNDSTVAMSEDQKNPTSYSVTSQCMALLGCRDVDRFVAWFSVNADDCNRAWIKTHPDHYLAQTFRIFHRSDDEFVRTCCEVTAASIRSVLTPDEPNWVHVDTILPDLCQIYFGSEEYDVDHILTRVGAYCIDSDWSDRRGVTIRPWTDDCGRPPSHQTAFVTAPTMGLDQVMDTFSLK